MNDAINIEYYTPEIAIFHMADRETKNRFTDQFVALAIRQLNHLQSDRNVKVVILKGLSDIFCAGATKEELIKLCSGEISAKDLLLSETLLAMPVPVIAAMEGGAVGGGLVVGLCADIILMAERSMYGGGFTDLGFTPGMGFTRLLGSLVGEYIANEMMFTGSLFKGRCFRARVNYVLPKQDIMSKAISLAEIISEKPRKTLEVLKYSLSMEKRKCLIEARVHEDFMHQITFNQPGIQAMIEQRYPETS